MDINIIQKKLDYYKKFLPINFESEKKKFYTTLAQRRTYSPIFKYRDVTSLKQYQFIHDQLRNSHDQDPVISRFIELYQKIALLLIAWKKADYQKLTVISGSIFGSYEKLNLKKTINQYNKIKKLLQQEKSLYSSKQLAKKILAILKENGIKNWSIEYSSSHGTEVSIYELEKKIIIKPNHYFSEIELNRIICHEIRGHAFQTFNALKNRKYSILFTNYLGTELNYEGLAIFTEISELPSIYIIRIINRYLLFMIAIKTASESSFYHTYKVVYNLCKDQEFSFMAVYRAKRGFKNTSEKGTLQIDNSYLFGALQILRLIKKDKNNYLKIIQGSFPLSAIQYINPQREKWVAVKQLNHKNINLFCKTLEPILD